MDPMTEMIRAIVRDTIAELAPHLRSGDEPIPLAKAAEMIGAPLRALRLAARRGELVLEGPRCARVVRRSELDRWLASHRSRLGLCVVEGDERADARASIAAS